MAASPAESVEELERRVSELQLRLDGADRPGEKLKLGWLLEKTRKTLADAVLRTAVWEGDLPALSAFLPALCSPPQRELANLSFDGSADPKAGGDVSLLYIAAQQGHAAVVGRLLGHGASFAATTPTNATPLFVACKGGHAEAARVLIAAMTADYVGQLQGLEGRVASPGNAIDGWAALHMAAHQGHAACVAALAQGGAALDAALEDGTTAVHIATARNQPDVLRVLCLYGAAVDATKVAGSNATSLLIAAQK
eukprot:SAG22_NODE_5963_length_924_cov_1.562424_1_plen_252_part_10